MKNKENELELLKSILATKRELGVANRNFETAESELLLFISNKSKQGKTRLFNKTSKTKRNICRYD